MSDEFAYLIERTSPVGRHLYLFIEGNVTCEPPIGRFGWTTQHEHALRFSRRDDAMLFIGAFIKLTLSLPVAEAIYGFRPGDDRPVAVKHGWGL